jgi:hypothetical protein
MSGRQGVTMHAWRNLIASVLVAAAAAVALASLSNALLAVLAGAVLVLALAALARNAIRLASEPTRRDVEPPQLHG